MQNANESISLADQLDELMQVHNLQCQRHDDWVVPNGKLPAMRMNWQQGTQAGMLEVVVMLEDQSLVSESFAGAGTGAEAIRDGLNNFVSNSFHVLLAAFWDIELPGEISKRSWAISGTNYTAYIGNFGMRGSQGVTPEIAEGFFDVIEAGIHAENLTGDTHWFRHFFCDVNGEQTFESLHNNEPWPLGLKAMQALPWAKSKGMYTVRHFLVLHAVT